MTQFQVDSNSRLELIDVTGEVEAAVKKSGVAEGVAVVFTAHTTTGIVVNEFEPNLVSDVESFLKELIPGREYKHDRIDDNADSHLRAIVLSSSVVVPVSGGGLDLGAWQKIILIELDGPRKRTVKVRVLGAT